jgi:UDP-glucose 4-epimerase
VSNKKVFLTGGNGFIGKNFIENMSSFYEIDAPLRIQLELTDTRAVDEYFSQQSFDYIIHAANKGGTRKSHLSQHVCLNENLRAFSNVFKHQSAVEKFIQLGSGAEYGCPLKKAKVTESEFGENIPTDEYGFSKYISSKMIEAQPPAKAITLHLFAIFGPYEDYQMRFISQAIVRSLFNLPILINQDVVFDYLYSKDCIEIISRFINNPTGYERYNIGSGNTYRLSEIAEMIKFAVNSNNDILIKNKHLNNEYSCNIDRLKDFLGKGFLFTPIQVAIKELVVFYENNLGALNQEWVLNPC